MITIRDLERLHDRSRETIKHGPFLRTHLGELVTVATNGYAMLGVRGKLTRNRRGPPPVVKSMKWGTPTRYCWEPLREFLLTKRKPQDHRGPEPIGVHGCIVDGALIRMYVRKCKGEYVHLSQEQTNGWPSLLIDGPDWVVLCMAMVRDDVIAHYVRPIKDGGW